MIAKLIGGGFPTRVYYAYQGGFDTHANQLGTHARVFGDVAQALAAFRNDLRDQQNADRVLVARLQRVRPPRRRKWQRRH